jgi:hypothetical protein
MDGSMGATASTIPSFKDTQPGGDYEVAARNGGLEITMDAGGALHAFANGSSTDILSTLVPGSVTTGTFWDQRTGSMSTTVDVDVSKLRTDPNFPATAGKNGFLYVKNYKAATGSADGVRLVNGSDISAATNDGGKGLTVITPDPVFLKGDYNNPGVTAGTNLNIAAPPADYRPAGILADSLYLLSNAWADSANQSNRTSGNGPTASNTTYNMAFVAGNSASTMGGAYGGGVENFPRFLENWSGMNNNINGSICCFQHAQVDTSGWNVQPHVYSPPNRHWSFDTNLLGTGPRRGTPPGTPRSVSVIQALTWQAR